MPAEKVKEILENRLSEHRLSLQKHIVCCTTDSVMVKFKGLVCPEHQLYYSHALHLAAMDGLHQRRHPPDSDDIQKEDETEDDGQEYDDENSETCCLRSVSNAIKNNDAGHCEKSHRKAFCSRKGGRAGQGIKTGHCMTQETRTMCHSFTCLIRVNVQQAALKSVMEPVERRDQDRPKILAKGFALFGAACDRPAHLQTPCGAPTADAGQGRASVFRMWDAGDWNK